MAFNLVGAGQRHRRTVFVMDAGLLGRRRHVGHEGVLSRKVVEAFRDWATSLPETLGVFVTTGNEDFIIHVAVPDNNSLYAFVIDKLTQRPEVADVRTSVVYEHIRNSRVVPLV